VITPLLLQGEWPGADREAFLPTGSRERLAELVHDGSVTARVRRIVGEELQVWELAVAGAAARVTIHESTGESRRFVTAASLLPVAAIEWFCLGDRCGAPSDASSFEVNWLRNPGGHAPDGAAGARLIIEEPSGQVGIAIVQASPIGYYWGPVLPEDEQVRLIPGTGLDVWFQLALIL